MHPPPLFPGVREIDDILLAMLHVVEYNKTHVGMNATLHAQIADTDMLPYITYYQYDIPLYVRWPEGGEEEEEDEWPV